MKEHRRFAGLDVHAETIAVAVAERGGGVRALGVIPNRAEAIRRVVKRLGRVQTLHACYEAGPCGVRAVLAAHRATVLDVVLARRDRLGHRRSSGASLVCATLRMGVATRGGDVAGVIFHSDSEASHTPRPSSATSATRTGCCSQLGARAYAG